MKAQCNLLKKVSAKMTALLAMAIFVSSHGDAQPLPDPDGNPADMTKPVQVFIMMGQSNMLGFGNVSGGTDGRLDYATQSKGLYPYLIDDANAWTTRQDVRQAHVQGRRQQQFDECTR